MISVDEALKRITGAMIAMPVEQIALAAALGRVLAEDVIARRTQPPMAVSAMDGYAVRAEDVQQLPVTLEVVGTAPAGEAYDNSLRPHHAVRRCAESENQRALRRPGRQASGRNQSRNHSLHR